MFLEKQKSTLWIILLTSLSPLYTQNVVTKAAGQPVENTACEATLQYDSMSSSCSPTATKYQKYGLVESRPFLPGERFSVAREMDRNVKGFREISWELALARRMVEKQEKMRKDSTMDKVIKTSFYKSVVGTR